MRPATQPKPNERPNDLGLDGFEFVEFTSPDPEALAGLFVHWLQLLPQQNLHWIVLLLPLHVGLLLGLRKR